MNSATRYGIGLVVVGVAVAGSVVGLQTDPQPVRVTAVSCDTGGAVNCDATVVNEHNRTGYNLAVRVVGYNADGTTVTTYTNDGTTGGGGIVDISPGAVENISISTSSPEPVVEADVRTVDIEAVEG